MSSYEERVSEYEERVGKVMADISEALFSDPERPDYALLFQIETVLLARAGLPQIGLHIDAVRHEHEPLPSGVLDERYARRLASDEVRSMSMEEYAKWRHEREEREKADPGALSREAAKMQKMRKATKVRQMRKETKVREGSEWKKIPKADLTGYYFYNEGSKNTK